MTSLTPEKRAALWQQEEQYREMRDICRTCWCAECQGELTTATNPEDGSDILRCAADKNHKNYSKKKSLHQMHREGWYVPFVSERIEAREKKGRKH